MNLKPTSFCTLSLAAVIGLSFPMSTSAESNWEGRYVGLQFGASAGDFAHIHENRPTDPSRDELIIQSPNGLATAISAGQRWGLGNGSYAGVEFSLGNYGLSETTEVVSFGANRVRTADIGPSAALSVTYAQSVGDWLIYGEAGIAATEISLSGANLDAAISGSSEEFEFGYRLALGGERMITDTMSFQLEYELLDVSGSDRLEPCVGSTCDVGFSEIDFQIGTLFAGVNFRF